MIPLTFHRYVGKGPPFAGVAVHVTDAPGQKGFGTALMLTPAVGPVLTDTVCWMLDDGLLDVQFSLDVNVQ